MVDSSLSLSLSWLETCDGWNWIQYLINPVLHEKENYRTRESNRQANWLLYSMLHRHKNMMGSEYPDSKEASDSGFNFLRLLFLYNTYATCGFSSYRANTTVYQLNWCSNGCLQFSNSLLVEACIWLFEQSSKKKWLSTTFFVDGWCYVDLADFFYRILYDSMKKNSLTNKNFFSIFFIVYIIYEFKVIWGEYFP